MYASNSGIQQKKDSKNDKDLDIENCKVVKLNGGQSPKPEHLNGGNFYQACERNCNGYHNQNSHKFYKPQYQQQKERKRKSSRVLNSEDRCAMQLAMTFFYSISIVLLICAYRIRTGDKIRRQQLQERILSIALNASVANKEDFNYLLQDRDVQILVPWEQFQLQSESEIDDDIIIPEIEFELMGNFLELDKALDLFTDTSGIEKAGKEKYKQSYKIDKSHVRIFLGVTSECCSEVSLLRRKGIRETWFKIAYDNPNVEAKFLLAQPAPEKIRKRKALQLLSNEIITQAHKLSTGTYISTDMVVVPGKDTYINLPNKTIRLIIYALSSAREFTHILKTDDDCYIRVNQLVTSLSSRFEKVYTGCVENRNGFMPVRDTHSKWFLSEERLPDKDVPWGVRYIAGWGYVLSRDVAAYFVQRIWYYRERPERAPKWFEPMDWEDVLVGLIVADVVGMPDDNPGFKPGWRSCTNMTLIKHLDFDSPKLLSGLYQQELNKLWDTKTVQCNTGTFLSNNWQEWYQYRNSLQNIAHI
eukprot:TRINITY_DN8133_c0_g2_i2.p1 TRINITY_DN8133_c0_g2~~TRINITY_DN8133_c0_g2_i2.p1  ORF type:complete len:529 (-),score=40.85 TRINITY_DN8133_c0_g2_i2:1299-2885(-)